MNDSQFLPHMRLCLDARWFALEGGLVELAEESPVAELGSASSPSLDSMSSSDSISCFPTGLNASCAETLRPVLWV